MQSVLEDEICNELQKMKRSNDHSDSITDEECLFISYFVLIKHQNDSNNGSAVLGNISELFNMILYINHTLNSLSLSVNEPT